MKSTLDDLIARRSIRSYTGEQITDEDLNLILEAGTYAPSGQGHQSAVIVVVQNKAVITKLSKLNADALNMRDVDPFYGAPTVLAVLADKTKATPYEDGCLILGNLMNAAYAVGLGSCWIHRGKEVFEMEEGKELLRKWGLDNGNYMGIAFCLLGYPAENPGAKPRKKGFIIRDTAA
ncbi:MAG: nitroreductase [Treponema sp.]|jgi:nitroreductase|nr:nitroreductase [Treponema sp.]